MSSPADPPARPARPLRRRPAPAGTSARSSATLHQWMQRTPTLQGLQQQALGSRRMGEQLAQLLPRELAAAVLPGRYAEGAWTLNASSSAVAAKLKLFVPLLLRRLQQEGWPLTRIQVRVLMPASAPTAGGPQAAQVPAPPQVQRRLREMIERRKAQQPG